MTLLLCRWIILLTSYPLSIRNLDVHSIGNAASFVSNSSDLDQPLVSCFVLLLHCALPKVILYSVCFCWSGHTENAASTHHQATSFVAWNVRHSFVDSHSLLTIIFLALLLLLRDKQWLDLCRDLHLLWDKNDWIYVLPERAWVFCVTTNFSHSHSISIRMSTIGHLIFKMVPWPFVRPVQFCLYMHLECHMLEHLNL